MAITISEFHARCLSQVLREDKEHGIGISTLDVARLAAPEMWRKPRSIGALVVNVERALHRNRESFGLIALPPSTRFSHTTWYIRARNFPPMHKKYLKKIKAAIKAAEATHGRRSQAV